MTFEEALFQKKIRFQSWEVVPLLEQLAVPNMVEYRCASRSKRVNLFGIVITGMRCSIDIHRMAVDEHELTIVHDKSPFSGGLELFTTPVPFSFPSKLRIIVGFARRPSVLPDIRALVYWT